METIATKKEVTEGKLLTFALGDEEYCIEILRVREIIDLMDITTVPQAPDYMKGVINLRGKVIPVIDLKLKFSMQEEEHTQGTCVIVVDVGAYCNLPDYVVQAGTPQQIGIIVDSVSEVLDIKSGEIEETPGFGQGIDTDFIMDMGKTRVKIIILLDIERVLSSEEMEMVGQLAEE